MTLAVLEDSVSSAQAWIQLPGVHVIDLPLQKGGSGSAEPLCRALEMGVAADPDPKRHNFFEASVDGYRYYFNVLPGRPAKVYLVARWREA